MHSIGDGKQTLFWKNQRASKQPLVEVANQPVPEAELNRKVADYWQPGLCWRWKDFERLFPMNILNHIQAVQAYPGTGIHDDLYRGKINTGAFSLSLALEILKDERSTTNTVKWKKVWRLEAPQKMKVFIWLVLHQVVLANDERVRRGFASNLNCFNCQIV